jgi:hypothetical protein
MADFVIKQNDTWPPMVATLTQADGQPIDLTGAGTISMWMKSDSLTISTDPCDVVGDPSDGVVSYTFTSADTATAGTYRVEWDIDFGSGKRQTAPNDGYKTVEVVESLDPS